MFTKDNKLSLCATSNGNVRILVDGKVHPLMAGYSKIGSALSVVFSQDITQRLWISDTAYFHWVQAKHECELVETGVHSRPEQADEEGFQDMCNLISSVVSAKNNGEALLAVATFRKKLKTELMPEFDNKDLTYGHKRIPKPLVPFFMKEFDLLGKIDDSLEEKPYGDERLLAQVQRLQKSLQALPVSYNKTKLLHLAANLTLAVSNLQATGVNDWNLDAKIEYIEPHPDTPFGDYQMLHDLRDIQARVEHLPAGFHQSTLSMKLGEASHGLQNLLMTGTHYWPNIGSDYPK